MNVKSVTVRPGFAYMTLQQDGREYGYSGVWSFDVYTTDDTFYEISLFTPGRPDSLAGLIGLSNWDKKDKLLTMNKYEYPSRDRQVITPISGEDVKQLEQVLMNIKEGGQLVLNQYGDKLNSEYKNEVVSFLKPRIEMGARLLDEWGRVLVGEIENGLKNKQEKPHLPRA